MPNEYRRDKEAEAGPTKPWGDMKDEAEQLADKIKTAKREATRLAASIEVHALGDRSKWPASGGTQNHVSIDVFNDAPDPVRRPSATPKPTYDGKGNASHYQGEIECIDAIRVQLGDDGFTAFLRGTIARYIWRLGQKDAAHLEAVKVGWYSRALENHLKRLSK